MGFALILKYKHQTNRENEAEYKLCKKSKRTELQCSSSIVVFFVKKVAIENNGKADKNLEIIYKYLKISLLSFNCF